ncbi:MULTISPECIES: hypothetical protein [unclassified Streptomyces]|uniref:hypothetical protein n=1 Tax=Streptomyces TaxID=1883 RepID=UPI00136F7408|nr:MULTISPECIES: hypothetical protein [unclassified Streptomyces]NEA03436.1 hypothetical protein [Streptomyces sp. SID10116]MYY83911.1 hypothetical protein [Streptomyces sp. SID335]MYZ14089.1 hypothetical protein [Streptomyces sp. SID337]NDZ84113.1 hypothetical protein [Streptomyces sp. SID10115]NEA05961.1 hypothetical protein [Streptomyces sp. SID10116]
MQQTVYESITYSAPCPDCAAELKCTGSHALVGDRLQWDVASTCSACGCRLLACGDDLPRQRRDQILAAYGPAKLRVSGPPTKNVAVMRVLRAEFDDMDLVTAKTLLLRLLSGDCTGTLPEMELLARKLRAAGVTAVATRP